jgi:hypothetical protein
VIEVQAPYREGTSWQGGMNPRYTKFVGGVTKPPRDSDPQELVLGPKKCILLYIPSRIILR